MWPVILNRVVSMPQAVRTGAAVESSSNHEND